MKLYKAIAQAQSARQRCIKAKNAEWEDKWEDRIEKCVNQLPHGSGIDAPTQFDYERSNDNRLIFFCSFHKMDEWGGYDGWIDYDVVVKPSLQFDFELLITGNFGKHQDIKDYLYDVYGDAFNEEFKE